MKRQIVYSLHLHLVLIAKYRKKVFIEQLYEWLHFYFAAPRLLYHFL